MARDQRRLAAIVSADVAGYSRLMGQDESGILAALKTHRRELIDPKIAEYGGRIVKTTGDGLLLEFPSVVDAVRCAVDVQRGMAERNEGVPPEQRIEFRIGINVGDIIIDGDDIHGDGVNVAARLQSLAEPGGVCVSRVVRDQVLDKLSFAFEEMGAQQVKNIARPIEVYRVGLQAGAAPSRGRTRLLLWLRPKPQRWVAAGAVAIGIVGVASWALLHFWQTPSIPSPPALSAAVIPFVAPNGTSSDVQLAGELTQGIARVLGHTMRYATIVPHLAAPESGRPEDPRAVGHEHNVRYLVDGDVRTEGDRVAVTARLLDANSAKLLWSAKFDLTRSQWVADPAGALWPLALPLRQALFKAEVRRIEQDPVERSTATELLVRGLIADDGSLNGTLKARKLYDAALHLDPNLTTALIFRSGISWSLSKLDPNADRAKLALETDEFARRAVASDRTDPDAWLVRAWALLMQWRWDAALEADAEAMRLEPHSYYPLHTRAWILSMMGRADEALPVIDQALALEPRAALSPDLRHSQCYALLLLGQFDRAIVPCEQSVAVGDDWWPYMFLTAAYAQTGDRAKATASKDELMRRRPGFSIAQFRAMGLSDNSTFWQQNEQNFIPGLRKAGIPEQ